MNTDFKESPDWLRIRNEYIATNISYRKLSAKYNISFKTLGKRATRENWHWERYVFRQEVAARVAVLVAEKMRGQ